VPGGVVGGWGRGCFAIGLFVRLVSLLLCS